MSRDCNASMAKLLKSIKLTKKNVSKGMSSVPSLSWTGEAEGRNIPGCIRSVLMLHTAGPGSNVRTG